MTARAIVQSACLRPLRSSGIACSFQTQHSRSAPSFGMSGLGSLPRSPLPSARGLGSRADVLEPIATTPRGQAQNWDRELRHVPSRAQAHSYFIRDHFMVRQPAFVNSRAKPYPALNLPVFRCSVFRSTFLVSRTRRDFASASQRQSTRSTSRSAP